MKSFSLTPSLQLALALVLMVTVFVPAPAHAYIDPGSGSYVLQVAMASIVGIGFTVKTYWSQIKTTLSGWFGSSKTSN